ncbi:MAG: nuclear transport factor 2 family protein [Gemmatimonadetes bacterium]|nr:nuclear transport factor 2 family protein [Gemmatimonadota bacterium]
MVEVAVTIEGPLAQAWARYEARFGDPGDVAEWSGIDAFTLMKHDGRWRIVSLAYAPAS